MIRRIVLSSLVLHLIAGCSGDQGAAAPTAAVEAPPGSNPLLVASDLPYGLPPFDKIADEHYAPALEQGMAEQLAEIRAIASNGGPPTFENTIVAMERSGQLLRRARLV